jgi:hypothetical protein
VSELGILAYGTAQDGDREDEYLTWAYDSVSIADGTADLADEGRAAPKSLELQHVTIAKQYSTCILLAIETV